ncbi:hypothetical protein B0H10DRAFT_2217703 [Mycena sp. CBHHK59/15]|nr:hypothetical protein B0H10DRAFT_2217703 [Mycena sp. CBHHK59/15]
MLDIENIVRAVYEDDRVFRTNRMKLQFIFACLVSALSSERPGAILVSDCYQDTNEAITWADLEFHVFPNAASPNRPYVGIRVRIRLHKGHRHDPSCYKWFWLWLEPCVSRPCCRAWPGLGFIGPGLVGFGLKARP